MQRLLIQTLFFWCLLVAGLVGRADAQTSPSHYDYARPGLNWYTIETDHFLIHFHGAKHESAASRTAQVVARVAEDVYAPVTNLYRHEPDTKVDIVLVDYMDYSNGAAYFFDNTINIWVPYLDSHFRGDHNWLRNVITHEFTHIVQIQTAMKSSRRWPFTYLQYFSYEDVRRPDVLYGYPDGVISYPVPTVNVPAWLAEGTAQYQRAGLQYDSWDSHRDMLLRTQVLAGQMFNLPEMGGFYSHNSLERESVYNHGYAFTRYLAQTYGEDVLRRISEELSEWDNLNIEHAMGEALGQSAEQVFGGWTDTLTEGYQQAAAAVQNHQVAGEPVETKGFINLHPTYSPDGSKIAYLSNQDEDFGLMSLYVRDLATGQTAALPVEPLEQSFSNAHCVLGEALVSGINGRFGWHPSGKKIVYARLSDSPEGFRYSDLYELDLETHESTRLTQGQRASAPVYAPNDSVVVFVGQKDGTSNLYQLDLSTGKVVPVTRFSGGVQVTDPVWHPNGKWIYFARTTGQPRDLYRVRPDGSGLEPVLVTPANERAPVLDPSGRFVYFASDRSGIYNIYRMPVGKDRLEPLTNVVGGAFTPSVNAQGDLIYANYQAEGYQINRLSEASSEALTRKQMAYQVPTVVQDKGTAAADAQAIDRLNTFDDTDIRALGGSVPGEQRAGEQPPTSAGEALPSGPVGPDSLAARPYQDSFTSFSVYPVLRVDQYARNVSSVGRRLLRNTKAGVYIDSREMLGDMRLFGGLSLGWASEPATSVPNFFSPARLISLERDAFLQFDYGAGLPFIEKRWSPQLSVQLYNIRRNVEDGMAIEEFPCTACYPDTTHTDVSYGIWEADLYLRSKISRSLLVELGYRYSPYRVSTNSFYSKEHQQTVPGTSDQYFVGRALTVNGYFEQFHPHRYSDVLREGWRLAAGYEYEPGRLLDRFAIESGQLVPKYRQYRNHRLWLETYLGMRLPGQLQGAPHGFSARLQGRTVLGGTVDDFFNSYTGGLTGARGYPFYALGGNETVWLQLAYHLPLIPEIQQQFLFLYADKLYARIYADAAAAWSGRWPGGSAVRKDVGAELRLGMGSFYMLPTAIFVSATYGLDRFSVPLSEGFVTPQGTQTVTYGQEWLWHFGVVFDFDFDI